MALISEMADLRLNPGPGYVRGSVRCPAGLAMPSRALAVSAGCHWSQGECVNLAIILIAGTLSRCYSKRSTHISSFNLSNPKR